MRLSAEHAVTKVFVDASEETSLPRTVGLHEFGTHMSEEILRIQFAVVMSPVVRKELLFLETVTVNRGMKVKMFDTREEALEWLQG